MTYVEFGCLGKIGLHGGYMTRGKGENKKGLHDESCNPLFFCRILVPTIRIERIT